MKSLKSNENAPLIPVHGKIHVSPLDNPVSLFYSLPQLHTLSILTIT